MSLDGSPHQWSHVIYVQSINHSSTRYLQESFANKERTQIATGNGYCKPNVAQFVTCFPREMTRGPSLRPQEELKKSKIHLTSISTMLADP